MQCECFMTEMESQDVINVVPKTFYHSSASSKGTESAQ